MHVADRKWLEHERVDARHGDRETRRHGDTETRRHGDTETRRHGVRSEECLAASEVQAASSCSNVLDNT
ncbi:hypothetical protein GCM10023156_45050 [Novipirellula rosea]|uniref:Uncharacterized protein n=1 Tax=Novipirellula rosea TaxID=1031540 RepID=A0ABP8NA74_9BACT